MNTVLTPGRAAALRDQSAPDHAGTTADARKTVPQEDAFAANREWEIDRALMLERSERKAWRVALAGLILSSVSIAAVFLQGPLRRVVEIPIVVDHVTGETTIQQRLSVETIPPMDALDKHNLATFVRAREGYSWMFLQRDFEQVARMAVPDVFGAYNRAFEGEAALQTKIGAAQEWRINVVSVRLSPASRAGNRGEATVTYDKVVRFTDRTRPDASTRHVASVLFQYLPKVLANERDRLENPFGFVVTAYRSDPEVNTAVPGAQP
ncbi:MAG: type IV secretion system protein [Paucibacter sp.]|nr:type IV secretion system protein [Roseateles sp.]